MGKAMNLVKGVVFNLAAKVVPKLVMMIAQWNERQYRCVCTGYAKPFAKPGWAWAVVPSFKVPESKVPDALYFSLVKKEWKSGRVLCQYDAKMVYQACYKKYDARMKSMPFTPRCDSPSCQAYPKGCRKGADLFK